MRDPRLRRRRCALFPVLSLLLVGWVPWLPTQTPLPGKTSEGGLLVADLDGDGTAEVLTYGFGTTLWHPDGWWPEDLEPVSHEPTAVVDFDGDGLRDLIVSNGSDGRALSHGAGWAEVALLPHWIDGVAADIDGDGDEDVVDGGPSWWENRGGGLAWVETPLGLGTSFYEVDAGDMDGDGDVDIVAGSAAWPIGLSWFESDGTGFGWVEHPLGIGLGPEHVQVIDADGDGALDVLWADDTDISLISNSAASPGSFAASVTLASTAGTIEALRGARVGADLEVLVARTDPGGADLVDRLTLSGGVATYGPLGAFTSPMHGLGWGDVDGDGTIDAVAGGESNRIVAWDGFPTPTVRTLADGAINPRLDAADLDGDGDLDLIVVDQGDVLWHENVDGYGAVWARHEVLVGLDPGAWSLGLAVGDVDGDLAADLVVHDDGDDALLAFVNDGTGTAWSTVVIGVEDVVDAVDVGDIDGDGDTDVLVGAFGLFGGEVAWWRNDGATWTRAVLGVAGASAEIDGVGLGDVDGDGDLDVVVSENDVLWYDNRAGNGSFWTSVVIDFDQVHAEELALADVDLDGDVDLIGGSEDFLLYEQSGAFGQAWTERTGSTSGSLGSIVVGDLDLDGDPDVVGGHTFDGLLWYDNGLAASGVWSDWAREVIDGGERSAILTSGDVDGDGDIDLFVAGVDGTVRIWRNQVLAPADDLDGDGLSDADDPCPADFGLIGAAVDGDGDGVPADCDCDDADPLVSPVTAEVCNGVDDDCDGLVDEGTDVDGDGITSCGADEIPGTADDDCDDAAADAWPGAPELCDGRDTDCDGVAEDDADLDGAWACEDCDDAEPLASPFEAESPYDGIDNDCDPATPDDDLDGDGFGIADDCDDGDAAVNPAATEICGNGVDEDCDEADLPCDTGTPPTGTDPGTTGPGTTDPGTTGPGTTDTGTAPTTPSTPTTPGDTDEPPVEDEAKGCGCASGGTGAGWLVVFAAAALVRRRSGPGVVA